MMNPMATTVDVDEVEQQQQQQQQHPQNPFRDVHDDYSYEEHEEIVDFYNSNNNTHNDANGGDNPFILSHHDDKIEPATSQETQPMSSLEVEQPLPSVAEITGGRSLSYDEEGGSRRRNIITSRILVPVLVLAVFILLSVAIGVGVGLKAEEDEKQAILQGGGGGESGEEGEVKEAVVDLQKRYDEVVLFLSEGNISPLIKLQDDGSPQQLAATWMSLLDPLLLPIPHSHMISEGYQFVTRYVMMVLYFSTRGDESWTKKRHFKTALPTCEWWEINLDTQTNRLYDYTGVICNTNGIITSLVLPDAQLQGSLPDELGLLFSIKSMVFNKNEISGEIPSAFEKLINLQDLWIGNNRLTGPLPHWIGRLVPLRSLDLSHNRMAGTLPVELGSLQYLEMLALDNNRFSGKVDYIFNTNANRFGGLSMDRLKFLYLEGNQFTGTIGDDFMYRPPIDPLASGGGDPSSSNPTTPSSQSSSLPSPLVAMDLSSNAFTGTLPAHIFSSFPNLRVFDVNNNLLVGQLPRNVIPNESLEFLALHKNQLTGEISGLLPDLYKLTHLDVSSNQFTGYHIDLGAMKSLSYLFLADNPFPAGAFPSFVSSLTNLQELSMKSTQRTGTIPTFLGSMTDLVLLDLDNNSFESTIPEELGNLTKLEFLLLNRNSLSSSIPYQFRDLTSLRMLFLDDNNLTGDLESVCSNRDPFVVADCTGPSKSNSGLPPVTCSCCDKCCSKEQPCNDDILIPNHDSAWQFAYERFQYQFGGAEKYEYAGTP